MSNNGCGFYGTLKSWLVPHRERLHPIGRTIVAIVGNIALAFLALPKWDDLLHLSSPYQEPINSIWVFLISIVPLLTLVVLLPVVACGRRNLCRLSIVLCIFPLYLFMAVWAQILFQVL
jgi:hypothetical protein